MRSFRTSKAISDQTSDHQFFRTGEWGNPPARASHSDLSPIENQVFASLELFFWNMMRNVQESDISTCVIMLSGKPVMDNWKQSKRWFPWYLSRGTSRFYCCNYSLFSVFTYLKIFVVWWRRWVNRIGSCQSDGENWFWILPKKRQDPWGYLWVWLGLVKVS